MANILGSLLVELGINTAAYKDGLDKATYQAKQFGSEVQKTFRELGESVGALAGSFGLLGPAGLAITETLSVAGQAAGAMIKQFSGINETFGVFAGVAGGVVAASVSVAASTTALAVETSKSIKEMGEQAQMAGVSVNELSKLSYAADLAGVSHETLVKGLERMNKAGFQAAEGNKAMQAAFHAVLGDGAAFNEVVSTGKISLEDLADGFSKIKDPGEKSALAMTLLSRGGAAMIPILNQGGAGLRAMGVDAEALGVTLNDKLVSASEEFQHNLTKIKTAGTGAAIQITAELLPSLNQFSEALVDDLKRPDSSIKDLVTALVDITKVVYIVGDGFVTVAQTIGKVFGGVLALIVEEMGSVGSITNKLVHLDFKGAESEAKDGAGRMMAAIKETVSSAGKDWEKLGVTAIKMFDKGMTDEGVKKPEVALGHDAVPKLAGLGGASENDPVKKMLAEIQEQIANELELIKVIGQGKAAYEVQKAEMDERKKLAQEQVTLETTLNGLLVKRKEAEQSGAPAATAQLDRQISDTKRQMQELASGSAGAIAGAGIGNMGGQIAKSGTALADLLDDQKQELSNLQAINAAAKEGGDALASAQVEQKFRKQTEALAQQREELGKLSPVTQSEKDAVAAMTAELDRQQVALSAAKAGQAALAAEQIATKIREASAALRAQADSYGILTAAAGKGAEAERTAAIAAAQAAARDTGKTTQEVSAAGNEAAAKFDEQRLQAINAMLAPSNELTQDFAKQREYADLLLQKYADQKEVVNSIHEQVENLNEQWAKQAIQIGTLSEKFGGFLQEIQFAGHNLGSMLFGDASKALDGLNSQLTNLLVTGKANFHQLGQEIEKSLVSTALKKTESMASTGLMNLFGIGGAGAKADGSKTNPFYVVQSDMFGSTTGAAGGAMSGGSMPDMSSMTGAFSGLGGLFSQFFGMFGGFLADGGDVTPGKAYMVGENHPEFFIPGQTGQIAPTLKTQGGGGTTVVEAHFHGVTDHDSFKRNQSQIMNSLSAQVARAGGRR